MVLQLSQALSMRTEREFSLALMNMHYNRSSTIDIDAIIDVFATKHPRRLLFVDILNDMIRETNYGSCNSNFHLASTNLKGIKAK